ncbi:hypothetical protein INS49_000258 [Diaporthe citri]|uniref:uncharacterized protein n=1 Tax=Diaporthe citri TaxID=83186 RepID=UPI001C7F2E54|nr:uncharacterized protein INS49_000258 [Diaporthe citri]KAG6366082.1 hypothetical protein INS49_000258 [Diaporthe citri]
MLTAASQFGPRARSLRTNHATATASVHRALAASGAATVQQCQQTRDFRFGWFLYPDSEVKEEIRRREKAFKQKYADQLSRRLDWDKHPLADDARHAVKRMMASYWISHDARPCGRQASKQRTPDNKDGVRPGQNIEDVERGAMEHLMFGKDEEGATRGQKSKRKRGGKKNKHNSVPHTSYGIFEHDDYFIDPVTNRKVAKHAAPRKPESGEDIPVKTFKDYRRRCSSGHGVSSDEPSTHVTLYDLMRQIEHAEAQKDPEPEFNDLNKYKPVVDDGQPVTQKESVQFEDLKPPYEDLHKYNSAVVDEVVARFESDKAPYSDLHPYDSVFEPDGASKEDAKSKHNEPHQKPLGHQVYFPGIGGFGVDYRPLVENLEPADFPPSTVEQLREKYGTAELRKYTAVRHLEPEENFSSPAEGRLAEEATKNFDSEEMAKHKPLYYNEPDGNPLPTADERVVEDLTKRYDPEELAKYTPVYWNEPDGQPIAAEDSRVAEGLTKEYDPAELAEYKPVYWNEPDGQPPSSMDERAAEGLTKNYDPVELHDYERPVQWNEPDGQAPTPAEELSKKYPDLDQYAPIGYQEPGGHRSGQVDAAQEGLEEMDARRDYESADRLASEELDRADEPSAEVLRRMGERQEIDEEYTETKRRQMLEQQMKKYQTASDATDYEASLAIKFARARAANVEPERQLTGNYVRDFPEEFDKSWTETLSKAPPETARPNDEFVFESQNMDGGLEGAFGRPSPAKIQPALDRHLDDQPHMTETSRTIENDDGGSSVAQDLTTVHADESGDTGVPPTYVKHYGDVSASADQASEATTPETTYHDSTNEPTLYKILAYDPTMQKIEIAETSSFVPDTASALTPADALLRLSHPTRFFPHFAPLQAEGYEIISGTGDVLVFRKVRPETSKGKPGEKPPVHDQQTPTADESGAVETRINPIDMTGRPRFSPASANFASPTGYVNYDNIPETAASKLPPPPPKIKYNIDVHREEPVFSGPKARSSDGQRGKKKSLGKRLVVGGVWVAGISYALGVITEFFTTGGMDGMGPTGL